MFKEKSYEVVAAMEAKEQATYFEELGKHKEALALEAKNKLDGGLMGTLEMKLQVDGLVKRNTELEAKNELNKSEIVKLAEKVESLGNGAIQLDKKSNLRVQLESKEDAFKNMKLSQGNSVTFEYKAVTDGIDHGNIVNTSDFATMKAGVIEAVKERTPVSNSFPTTTITGDQYKYTEQTAVRRDAKNVAYNTASAHTSGEETKETLTVSIIDLKIVKDLVDISTDLLRDFTFMESRTNRLIHESVAYKVEDQFINGTGLTIFTHSINSKSSEFDATNIVAPVDSITDANLIDLILSMDMQIDVLGDENYYEADTVLINRADWFKGGAMLKDSTGRYLDERIQRNGRSVIIDGKLNLITSNKVTAGNLYVYDSTKAEKIVRDNVTVEIAYMNGTKWEQEIATMKGYTRVNLLIVDNYKNAFMKCTDIPAALVAISTVP